MSDTRPSTVLIPIEILADFLARDYEADGAVVLLFKQESRMVGLAVPQIQANLHVVTRGLRELAEKIDQAAACGALEKAGVIHLGQVPKGGPAKSPPEAPEPPKTGFAT